jgi:hypothetical protein
MPTLEQEQAFETLWPQASGPLDRSVYRSNANQVLSTLKPGETLESLAVVQAWFGYPRWWQSFRAATSSTGALGITDGRLLFAGTGGSFELPRACLTGVPADGGTITATPGPGFAQAARYAPSSISFKIKGIRRGRQVCELLRATINDS